MNFATPVQFVLSGLTTGCIYALVALGFVMCASVSRIINFAQGEYVMLGGLLMASLAATSLPAGIGLVMVALAGGAVGVLQERLTVAPVRHLPPFIPITITLGVAVVMRGFALLLWGKDPVAVPGLTGDDVFEIFGAYLPTQTLWIWGLTAACFAVLAYGLKRTDLGRAIRACASNPVAARLMGIPVERMTLIVFGVAGGVGALAGAIIAPLALANWSAGLEYGLKGFVGAIIGRFTSPVHAVAGGIGLGIIESLAAGYVSSGSKNAIAYAILLVYLLVVGGALKGKRPALLGAGQHE